MVHERPASCKVRAALSPAIPAPTTAMWVMFLLLWRLTRDGCTSDTKTLSLVLTLVLRLGEIDGNIGHVIPGVVDADEQEQHRSRGDDEQCRRRIAWEHNRGDDEPSIGDERKDRMPEPVFQYWFIIRLTACPPEHDDHIGRPPKTRKAQQQASRPERLPGCAEKRGDQQRGAKMKDVGCAEGRNPTTRRRHAHSHPRDQGDHYEQQARQRRRSGADDAVKVMPGGKWRQQCLLHDGSSLRGQCQRSMAHPRERGRRMRDDWVA